MTRLVVEKILKNGFMISPKYIALFYLKLKMIAF